MCDYLCTHQEIPLPGFLSQHPQLARAPSTDHKGGGSFCAEALNSLDPNVTKKAHKPAQAVRRLIHYGTLLSKATFSAPPSLH